MVDNCVPAQSRPVALLRALGSVFETATVCLQGTRGDADDAAAGLLELIRSPLGSA